MISWSCWVLGCCSEKLGAESGGLAKFCMYSSVSSIQFVLHGSGCNVRRNRIEKYTQSVKFIHPKRGEKDLLFGNSTQEV